MRIFFTFILTFLRLSRTIFIIGGVFLNTRDIFKKNLNRFIEQSGKNKKMISEEMNIPYTTLAEWANGNKFPRADGIEKLANYFKILKSDLLEESKITDDTNNVGTILSEFREDNSGCSISLSEHEKRLISAYRDKPEMQPAVDKLLGIDSAPAKNIGEDIAETVIKTQNALNTKCNSHSK